MRRNHVTRMGNGRGNGSGMEMEWVVLDYAVGVTSPALYCPSIARDRVSLTWSEILLWPKVRSIAIISIYILLASIANITLHSTEDGWRGPDSKRCRQSTGGATTSTEPVLRTGPEAESKAIRSKEHPRDLFRAAQTPSADRVGVSEQSTAKTNLEIHCRCSQKSCSQSSSASNGCGGSSLSWHYTSTRTWSQW